METVCLGLPTCVFSDGIRCYALVYRDLGNLDPYR